MRMISAPATDGTKRPRLLYFNGPWDYIGPRLIQSYIEPFRRLLEQDFDVVSVQGDCDFSQEVRKHAPDVVLFHTGTESPHEREVTIRNTDAHPELPRMGWVFRDPCSPSRLAAMNRLRAWRVDQVFTDFRPTDCPIPFYADSIYVPWWVDDTLFRDYGEPKTLPVTLTGTGWLTTQFYAWRKPVFLQLAQRLPVYHVPAMPTHQQNDRYVGESYARLLNRSLFSAGCGSISRFITLKLLEIPAARSCLITEETEVMKAAGFVDGRNCIFATPENVVQKVQELLDAPARLQAVTDAGYRLVHEEHTQRNRRMFIEWFQLWKSKAAGQRILQLDPFGPLQLAGSDGAAPTRAFPDENPLTAALVSGYRMLGAQRESEAREKFEWVLESIPYVAEARLGAALCALHRGDLEGALTHMNRIIQAQVHQFAYKRADPVGLAFHCVMLIRAGRAPEAFDALAGTTGMKHPALNALRWALAQRQQHLKRKSPAFHIQANDESCNAESVHLLPALSFAGWTDVWTRYLRN